MITVIEYFNELKNLIENHPECKTMPVIYAKDDEGNAYHNVISTPSFFQVENLDEYYLEPDIENDGILTNPNCVIIN